MNERAQKIAKDPEGRLRFYAERFPVVENDASYYALPDPKQALLWRDRTPVGFTMSFNNRFADVNAALLRVIEPISGEVRLLDHKPVFDAKGKVMAYRVRVSRP